MYKILQFAFQSLGIVYGDLGTSPLYVFYNTFPDGVENTEDLIGALSLIIYSLTLITLIKYVFIVCKANDNGQGNLFPTLSYLYFKIIFAVALVRIFINYAYSYISKICFCLIVAIRDSQHSRVFLLHSSGGLVNQCSLQMLLEVLSVCFRLRYLP